MNLHHEVSVLDEEFFAFKHGHDPLTATELGLHTFDASLPDLSTEGTAATAKGYAEIVRRIADLRGSGDALSFEDRIDLEVMEALASASESDLKDDLWVRNISAGGYVAPQARIFQSLPAVVVNDVDGLAAYRERLHGLPKLFDTIRDRYQEADRQGHYSTEPGVRQAIAQLSAHLELGESGNVFQALSLRVELEAEREQIRAVVRDEVFPAVASLRDYLAGDPLTHARGDNAVGLCALPEGEELYARALLRHTTTTLTPEEIHLLGLETLAELEGEWAEVGGRLFGITDRHRLFERLRGDADLRFRTSAEMVGLVARALAKAEAALPQWFPQRQIAPCVIEEISSAEADNAALAYYRGPSDDGSRSGAHCILTTFPTERFRYEYEALAFHESVPGHHLQIATAQTLTDLPSFRRYLDAEVSAFVEGWGLYSERLADEMGLYDDDLSRLGMLSFDALRACRCVVDTGMHYYGWSRQRARDFMWENSATNMPNVVNEIDRYIGWPGQATAYLVGRRQIRQLRREAEEALGPRFDIRGFHGALLEQGALPLGVAAQVIGQWISRRALDSSL